MTESMRLITPPGGAAFLALRDEYLAACNGDACAALLLGVIESMTLYRQGEGYRDAEWVYMGAPEFAERLSYLFGETTIKRKLTWLAEMGYTVRRKNPRQPLDQTYQYRFEADVAQAAIDEAYLPAAWSEIDLCSEQNNPMQEPELDDATDKITSSNEQNYPMEGVKVTAASVETDAPNLLESYKNSLLESGPKISSSSSSLEAARGATADDDEDPQPINPTEAIASSEKSVYAIYAEEIGELTPMSRDYLVDAVADFGEEAVRVAIRAAVDHGARHWAYVRACLDGLRGKRVTEQVYTISPEYAAFVNT